MDKGVFSVPKPHNEPVKSYAPGSPERAAVLAAYTQMYQESIEVPLYIDGQEVSTGQTQSMNPPHDHQHSLGVFHKAGEQEVDRAVNTALAAREQWAQTPWEQRAAIFLRAAELVAGPYRARINAATMLAQSKTVHQAEIDAACEFIDFLRFNVAYMTEMYAEQPQSTSQTWNRLEYRPLEGFVYAITPFNFTAIAGNLPASAALMGNVVIWKPSDSQVYSAQVVLEVFKEAGVPPGVINMIMGDPVMITEKLLGMQISVAYTLQARQKSLKICGKKLGTTSTSTKLIRESSEKLAVKISSLPTLRPNWRPWSRLWCAVRLNFRDKNAVLPVAAISLKAFGPLSPIN